MTFYTINLFKYLVNSKIIITIIIKVPFQECRPTIMYNNELCYTYSLHMGSPRLPILCAV